MPPFIRVVPSCRIRLLALLAGALSVLSLALAALATSAEARVEEVPTKVGEPNIQVGLQHREASFYWAGVVKGNGLGRSEVQANPEAEKFANEHGHEVMHAASTYAIYWDPQDYYHGDWQGVIDGFLANLGAAGGQLASVFAVDTQYTDATNKPATSHSSFHGAYTDTYPYPETGNCSDPHPLKFGLPLIAGSSPVCLTAVQVQAELERFIKQREEEHHILPKGMGTIFYLLTPPGVTVCLNEGGSQCSDFNGTPSEISQYEEAVISYPEEVERYHKAQEEYVKAKAAYEKAQVKYETDIVKYEQEVLKYNKEKEAAEAAHEPFVEPEPVEPVKPTKPVPPVEPVKPTEPAGYASYKNSFCSYHGHAGGSGASAILYATIPWTAGGDGDNHLAPGDQTAAAACQDGGFEPGTTATGEVAVKEREHAEGGTETEAKEAGLAGPHDEEPNQLSGRGPDGSYDTGLADLIINQIAVEQQNTITDPLLNAWQDPEGNEVTDECRNFFGPTTGGSPAPSSTTKAGSLENQSLGSGKYYLNDAYNLAALARAHPGVEYPGLPYPGAGCLSGVRLEPQFTAPNAVNGGEEVGFNGMESNITLTSAVGFSAGGAPQPNYAIYTWNFGDGNRGDATPEVSGYAPGAAACEKPWLSAEPPAASKPPGVWVGCAASIYHAYNYKGEYAVTLTVKDVGGDEARTSRSITVEGEPWVEHAGTGSAGAAGGGGSSTPAGSSHGPGATTTAPGPPPVIAAAVVSHSLRGVLRSGLVVRYSINEQVAGHFEVLLATSIARRIGLHGPPATGLARGTVAQTVIGKAILVTTKGGRSTIRFQFGKTTASRLRRLHKVALMLRLVVRNANSGTTAFLTRFTLSG